MLRHWLSGLVLLVTIARVSNGQAFHGLVDGYLDLGGAVLRQPGLTATNVLTAAAQFRYATQTFALATNGVAAKTPDERFTGQGIVSASRYSPSTERFRWELTGTGSAFGLSNAAPAFAWQALAREHYGGSVGGAYLGGAYGRVARGGFSREVATAHTGGYLRFDALGTDELSAAIAYTDAGRAPDSLVRVRYVDAVGFMTHRTRWLELSGGAGVRLSEVRGDPAEQWAAATAAVWLNGRTAVVVSAGRALADVTRGVPSVRYVSLSLRLGTASAPAAPSLRVRRQRADDDGGRLDIQRGDDSSRIVSVRLAIATTLELMADFTDWEAVPMTRLPNGEWMIERVIVPGTHRVAIRVDGGSWKAPPNLPRVTDDFGGEVGIVIVP